MGRFSPLFLLLLECSSRMPENETPSGQRVGCGRYSLTYLPGLG